MRLSFEEIADRGFQIYPFQLPHNGTFWGMRPAIQKGWSILISIRSTASAINIRIL